MLKVQVQLSDGQVTALRNEADSSGRSVAAVVREALDDWMARSERRRNWQRALAVVGSSHSGLGDLAERHDDYLDEGFRP